MVLPVSLLNLAIKESRIDFPYKLCATNETNNLKNIFLCTVRLK